MDANGRPCGYDFEYLEAIAQYTGWKYEYVPVSIAEGIRRIVSGDLDIIGCMALDAERAKHMDYSEQPAGMGGNRLVSRMKDTRFAYGDLEALNGKTVGNLAGSTRYLRMKEYCHRHGFTVNFVEANTEKELFALLDESKVDLVLWSQAWKMEGYRSVLDFDQRPFYFVVSKSSPEVLRQLDWAMGELRAVQPYYDSGLRNKYFETYTKLSPSFTKKELEYIAAHREVSVSFDPDWYPIETLDRSSGTLGGIMRDVYELISRRTGITFRFVPRHSLADSQQQDSSTAQIHSLLCYDFSCSNAETMRFTQPVFDVQLECITGDRGGNTIALPRDGSITRYIEQSYSQETYTYRYYSTVLECLEAVRSGQVGMTFINTFELSYYFSIPKFSHLHFQPLPNVALQYLLSVSKDENILLYSIINKAIGNISNTEKNQIFFSHAFYRSNGTLSDLFYTNPGYCTAAIVFFLLAASAVFYYSARNRLVRRESRELEALNEQLRHANASKSDFLSRMSHDIRTPMNGIIGMTHIAMEQNNPPVTTDCLDKIDNSFQYLFGLINDVLDMSRIEQGEIHLHPEPYTAGSFFQYLNSIIQPLCDAKQQTLHIVDRTVRDCVPLLDRLRLNQVVFNLLSNAVKYTPQGGRIDFSVEESSHERFMDILITVSDNGIGMSPDFQKILFEPYAQEDRIRGRSPSGTGSGLGLAIVKKIVGSMQGTVEVRSRENEGSTFTVHLHVPCIPVEECQTGQVMSRKTDYSRLAGKHVLVCEDNAINQKIVLALLQKVGMSAEVADNGQTGVSLFRKSDIGRYDAVLMDIRMPVMDGYAATRAIRQMERTDAETVPIIAMSADAFEEDVRKCLAGGMNAHIAKPLAPSVVYDTLAGILQ